MQLLENPLPVFPSEQDSGDLYEEAENSDCRSDHGNLHDSTSDGVAQEIAEVHMDENYDEEDAEFNAQAEAFVRKCDAHDLAVRRLVEDLVEDDEVQKASANSMSMSQQVFTCAAADKVSDERAGELSDLDEASSTENCQHAPVSLLEEKGVAIPNKIRAEMEKIESLGHKKRELAGRRLYGNGSERNCHQFGKKYVHSMKDAQHENAQHENSSSDSPASNLMKSRTSATERKIVSKPTIKARTSSFSSRRLIQDEVLENTISDNEKTRNQVRELFGSGKPAAGSSQRQAAIDDETLVSNVLHSANKTLENVNSGPSLLKLAKRAIARGDNPQKALGYAIRAAKAFKIAADGKSSQELVMCSHVLAALHCSLGQYNEAVMVLENSLNLPILGTGTQEHALAAFAGYMQLGDTLSLLGEGKESLAAYCTGLEVQIGALGENDLCVGETCRYLAEAHAQALQFDTAEQLCQKSLDIHKKQGIVASVEEAMDRRLMGLIYNGKGRHEAALEQLVLARMVLVTNGRDAEVAAIDASMGDTYALLGRLDEAVSLYQKALKVLKASKGESQVTVASLYVSLGQLCLKTGKVKESRAYCESALRLYTKQGGWTYPLEEVASGLTEIAIIYESLNEVELAFSFLERALAILEKQPGQQSAVAGIEAQIGVFHYLHGDYGNARDYFSKAVSKLQGRAEKNSPLYGVVLNQMGLACVQLSDVEAAVTMFEDSRGILEAVCGPHHPDTLSANSNLAGAYDAMGRLDDAIAVLQHTLDARATMQDTADMEVEDERARLAELLKEAGQLQMKRCPRTPAARFQSDAEV